MLYSFQDFIAEYPDDKACLDKIMSMKFGDEPSCPGCGADTKFHRISKRRAYACQHCGHHVYPCVDTPFEKSRTSLQKWFFAMYLFTASKNGVSAKELQRQLKVTYKTAWRMADELRKLMAQSDDHEPLSGEIELDETYVGGRKPKVKGFTGRGAKGKTIVFGMVQRDGMLRAGPVPNVKRATLEPLIARNIQRGSTIFTDEFSAYANLREFGYRHEKVSHSTKEYVRGDVHVNTLEGYWSIVKRSIRGTHVHVSSKHLWKYISEFSYRYNMREHDSGTMFQNLVLSLQQPRLKDG